MFEVRVEAVFPTQLLHKRCRIRVRRFYDHSALLTDKVVVAALVDIVISRLSLAHVGLGDEVQLFEQLQGAVYGRYIGVGITGSDPGADFLGAGVAVAVPHRF